MRWELTSFALIGAVLLGGGVWYERSRPSAKVVAMVAALAALAVAGRVALAPIPNVVATTDIVLLAGYAIGGAPGFAVGALAALVSNFWLGQGPWTPWQMAGWGMVGIGGAALARLTGRRLGRLGLAAWCGFSGLAYGALLDLSIMVSYGGDQSLDRYLALSVRGIPFNVAHVAGNVVFALIAGPALVRMLLRFRSRSEVRWVDSDPRPRGEPAIGPGLAVGGLVLALCLGAAIAPGRAARADPGRPASSWLAAAQNPDGGFGTEAGGDSSSAMTAWSALGLEAVRINPFDVSGAGTTAIDYLRGQASGIRSAGDLERTILVLASAGADPSSFAGRDLASELAGERRPDGSWQRQINLTAFGIMALAAAGRQPGSLAESRRWLVRAQGSDGGWGLAPGSSPDADSAGAAIQGLAAGGGAGGAIRDGVRYLRRDQRGDGGWALTAGGPTNSQSTAWAIQGLVAGGVDPEAVRDHGHSGLDYLAARQASDGHYRYSSSSDQTPVWVTAQALVAVQGKAFPLAEVARASSEPATQAGAGATEPQASAPASGGSVGAVGGGPSGGSRLRGGREGGGSLHGGQGPADHGSRPVPVATSAVPASAPVQPTPSGDSGGGDNTLAFAILGFAAPLVAAGVFIYRRSLE